MTVRAEVSFAQVLNKPWPGAAPGQTKPKSHTHTRILLPCHIPTDIRGHVGTQLSRFSSHPVRPKRLRLGEGLRLQAGDIDADRMRVKSA
ncbi:MAG: hypothetical protein IPP36_13665 [Nitrosomonadales bacterium]|nr:hypothetical protein [Nitrosomonadales bacterium]